MATVRCLGVRMWCVSGVEGRAISHPSVQARQCSAGTPERHQVGEAEGDNGSVFNLEDSDTHPRLYTASSSQTRNPSDLLHIG